MNTDLQLFEPAAKVLAATAVSQTVSFCTERKYLARIDQNECFSLKAVTPKSELPVSWVKVKQIGKPLKDSAENCFTAIQKILYSCFIPKELQLLFLITSNEKENNMYLGLRKTSSSSTEGINPKKQIKYFDEFIKGAWPGLQTELVKEDDDTIKALKDDIASDKLEHVFALTGIPSMESQYKTVYPATMDMLMAGMNKSKRYAYLVVADPVPTNDVESMLYQCRDINGQVESLKSINVQESFSQGTSRSHTLSKSVTDSITKTMSESVSKKDFSKLGKAAMATTGLGLAASILPAAGEVLSGIATGAAEIGTAALSLVGFSSIGNLITGMMPTKTVGTSTSEGRSVTNGESDTEGSSENHTQSVSRNLLNKHVEAVAEHLYYHSKRFEAGKAIGMWKVGVYLMANKQADINSGALQLRSILSGQESVFEPVRIHDISNVVGGENCAITVTDSLAQLAAPTVAINNVNGKPFNHPFGEHYAELKTVLTTKELSYLINFPLHSVPGISVVNSCPDFCLNAQKEGDGIELGKLMFGGAETDIPYHIKSELLSRHTLVTGINGSGKTNTVQAILNGTENLPFLVIEPAKTEYVDWALKYNETHPENPISIYMPGCTSYRGSFAPKELHINPFDIVWLREDQEPNVLAHIDRIKSTFAAAFPLYDILPVLLEDLIYSVYQNKSTDWFGSKPIFGKTKAPSLNSMRINVEHVIGEHQYEERVGKNMMACLNTRIDSLRRGWKGELLGGTHAVTDEIYSHPSIINLSYVGDDTDKAFIMALILQRLYEIRQAEAEIGKVDFNSNTCRHLTVIEEAHRVMSKCENPELPQCKSAMMFSNILSEIRAYGEGFMLVDQVPTRLIPDAVKNTNLKICHRMVAEDDCKVIGESMSLSDEQRGLIPKLLTGQCIVSNSYETEPYWIKANKVK